MYEGVSLRSMLADERRARKLEQEIAEQAAMADLLHVPAQKEAAARRSAAARRELLRLSLRGLLAAGPNAPARLEAIATWVEDEELDGAAVDRLIANLRSSRETL